MRNTINRSLCLIVIWVSVLGVAPPTRAEAEGPPPARLTFVYTRSEDDPVTQWLILIYTEALRRMDIEFVLELVPAKRASLYCDTGQVDGDLSRVYSYSERHPNLIRVEEHNVLVKFSAFTTDSRIVLKGWKSLREKEYHVEYRRGISQCEIALPRVVPPERLSDVTAVHQGIQKLLLGRTDVYVGVTDYVMKYLSSDEFKQISQGRAVFHAGLMGQITGHAHLHKKHRALVPQLSAILGKMKEEGLFDVYREQTGIDLKW